MRPHKLKAGGDFPSIEAKDIKGQAITLGQPKSGTD